MNTDLAHTLGQQLTQMLGSLWSQAKLGLEVDLEPDDQYRMHHQGGPAAIATSHEPELCEWQGNLTANGLGSLDVGGAPTWLEE